MRMKGKEESGEGEDRAKQESWEDRRREARPYATLFSSCTRRREINGVLPRE